MKQNFAGRYAAMSDEQLEYEASQSDGFAIDARDRPPLSGPRGLLL